MRWRAFGLISLGVNVALAVALVLTARQAGQRAQAPSGAPDLSATNLARTNFVIRGRLFSWRDVESPDYATYIANLRDIGCPAQTIRDIIIADVNSVYAKKLASEIITPSQQWWRSEPDTNVLLAAAAKARALEEERQARLTELLGPSWESGDQISLPRPSRPGVVLDGGVLGAMTAETKQTVQEISSRSQDRVEAYLEAQRLAGKEADPVEIARLRQQTREELTRVLNPQQLEEFLLRYSQNADSLRAMFGELRYFNPNQDEFRGVFRAVDLADQQLLSLTNLDDPNVLLARKTAEDQRENAIKLALGARRYAEYRLLHDPLYREAMTAAIDAGTPEAARTIYQIKLAAAAQQASINDDLTLTDEQKKIQSKQLDLDQLKANSIATGQDLPPEPPPPPPPRRTYTLQPGDTPAVVSMIYGIPLSDIRAANPGVDINRLRPGDSLFIPRNTPAVRARP